MNIKNIVTACMVLGSLLLAPHAALAAGGSSMRVYAPAVSYEWDGGAHATLSFFTDASAQVMVMVCEETLSGYTDACVWQSEEVFTAGAHRFTFSDLERDTTYRFRVQAVWEASGTGTVREGAIWVK